MSGRGRSWGMRWASGERGAGQQRQEGDGAQRGLSSGSGVGRIPAKSAFRAFEGWPVITLSKDR